MAKIRVELEVCGHKGGSQTIVLTAGDSETYHRLIDAITGFDDGRGCIGWDTTKFSIAIGTFCNQGPDKEASNGGE
jgi:hypothetical protein